MHYYQLETKSNELNIQQNNKTIMKSATYFEIDQVIKINIHYERLLDTFKYYEKIEDVKIRYLFFFYSIVEGKPERFCCYGSDSKNYSTIKEINEREDYRFDFLNKKVYYKPKVHVITKNKDCITGYFDTNDEAQNYVDDLLNNSDRDFEVMVNK